MRIKASYIILSALLLQALLFLGASGLSYQSSEVVRAEEILDQIEFGAPVDCYGVIIDGDLNLSRLNIPIEFKERSDFEQEIHYLSTNSKIVESPIDIIDCEIRGTISSNNIIFNKSVSFKDCIFEQDAHFRGTQFRDDLSFNNASFAGNAYFEWTEFNQLADFQNSVFISSTHFLEATFSGDSSFEKTEFRNLVDMRSSKYGEQANFGSSKFGDDAYLDRTQFSKDVDFRNSQFNGTATFWSADFGGVADFRGSKFLRDATFSNSQFQGIARLGNINFYGNADFRRSVFWDDALIENSLFEGEADFRQTNFGKNVGFENTIMGFDADFSHAQFSNDRNFKTRFINTSFQGDANFASCSLSPIAQMRNSRLNGSLNMTHATFDRLEVKWDDIKNNLKCDDSVFILLINNFRNLGQFNDYDNCIYQYGKFRIDYSDQVWSKFTDILSWITCGFGVRPHFTIFWAILLITIFGYIYYFYNIIKKDINSNRVLQKNRGKKSKDSSFQEALYFSTMVFLVSLSPQGLRAEGKWRYLVMLEDILGWILMTLFVVTLGHVMIR